MTEKRAPKRVSVSTWSLHRTLGRPTPYGPVGTPAAATGGLALIDLPARLAASDIRMLEICHFHLPRRDPAYLDDLAAALRTAGVTLFSLLIDAGDMTDPAHSGRDLTWMAGWFAVAARLGAARVRVSGGKSAPDDAALAASVAGMRTLADQAEAHGLRLMTENWHATLSTPAAVLHVLDRLEGRVGLCVDFGNWSGAAKYKNLAAIMPRAESCHAKAETVADSGIDVADFRRCVALAEVAGFDGPYTLIYDGPHADEWAGLAQTRRMLEMP
jgi:sugar phosphate isomerase/epimerase